MVENKINSEGLVPASDEYRKQLTKAFLEYDKYGEAVKGQSQNIWRLSIMPFDEVPSTMDVASSLIRGGGVECLPLQVSIPRVVCNNNFPDLVTVIVSRTQSQGRGRQGRRWISTLDGGLYFTVLLPAPEGDRELSGFSLLLGLAVAKVCRDLGVSAWLKWPNDVLASVQDTSSSARVSLRKLSGVLVETLHDEDGELWVSFGIGLNLISNQEQRAIGGTALDEHLSRVVPSAELLCILLDSVLPMVQAFYQVGFEPFAMSWNDLSIVRGKMVSATMGSESFSGVAKDVDPRGGLEIDSEGGKRVLYAGEVIFKLEE